MILGDLQHILVATLRARDQTLRSIKIAEGDEDLDRIRIERQRALKTLRGIAAPLRIPFLAGSEEVPGLRVIRSKIDGLFEQHDRAVIVAGRTQLARAVKILMRDRALRRAPLQLIAAASGALFEQLVVCRTPCRIL